VLKTGLWFGGFQALMPFVGYLLGVSFADIVTSIDHWICFGLLLLIGINMIREALSEDSEEFDNDFSWRVMALMAVATSIDALVSGASIRLTTTSLLLSGVIIGIASFIMSLIGFWSGKLFKNIPSKYLELAGGLILNLLAVKSLF
jgi:putative Mn2+ efflux pump MntP